MKPDSLSEQSHTAFALCHNCQAPTGGNFCQNCGQETHLHPPSAREFLHEFVGHYVALEGKLLGTLGRLLFRPGLLTREYVAGRRVRFVQPLRLYLTLSVLFFALLKFTHGVDLPVDPGQVAEQVAEARQKEGEKAEKLPRREQRHAEPAVKMQGEGDIKIDDAFVEKWLSGVPLLNVAGVKKQLQHFDHLPAAEQSKILSEGFYHYAPYAMFLLMPIFALYLKLLYLGSGKRYGEHLLFALHSNSFAFIILGALFLIDHGGVSFLLWLWLLGYLPWAMRRVYQRGRRATAWRWLALMAVYVVTMGVCMLFTMGAGVLAAH